MEPFEAMRTCRPVRRHRNLLLTCHAEGLGCVLTTLRCQAEPAVRALLGLPEPWATCAFVPTGWPARSGHGPLSRRPLEGMAFRDRFAQAPSSRVAAE